MLEDHLRGSLWRDLAAAAGLVVERIDANLTAVPEPDRRWWAAARLACGAWLQVECVARRRLPIGSVSLITLQVHGTGSASTIARELDVPLGNLSYHVRRLERLGLIEEVSSIRRRGALMRVFRTTARFRGATATLLSEGD